MTTTITALAAQLHVTTDDILVLVDQLIDIDGAEMTLADESGQTLTDDAAEAIIEQIQFHRTASEEELWEQAKWHLGPCPDEDDDAALDAYQAVVDSLASTAKQVYLAAGWRIAEHAPNNAWTGWDEVESLADKVWSTWIADPKHAIQAEAVTGKDFS